MSRARNNVTRLSRTVSPSDTGAVGDGTANDTAALAAAMALGRIVDGQGLTYGVSGTLTAPANFKGLVNARLKQLAPTTTNVRTLYISGVNDFILRDVTVDRGGSAGYTVGTLSDYAGIWIASSSGWHAENCLVTNGGRGNGWSVQSCTDFGMVRCGASEHYWQEVNPAAPVITDDIIQPFWFNNNTRFSLVACYAKNITSGSAGNYATNVASNQQRKFTRWGMGGNSQFTLTGCNSDNVDQCFDLSGTVGNSDFVLDGCVAKNGGTYGFKFANSANSGLVTGCIAVDVGYRGFIVSGMTEVANPLVRDIDFVGCKAINVGSNGIWPTGTQGFRVMSRPDVDASYPRRIRFRGCSVEDRQNTPTCEDGFACDAAPVEYPATGYDKPDSNICDNDCYVGTLKGGGAAFSGIHIQFVKFTGTGTASISNNTWTAVDMAVDISDAAGLHSTASNTSNVYIKLPGLYMVYGSFEFAANATGLRKARIAVNGAADATIAEVQAHATGVTSVQIAAPVFITAAGQNVRIELLQDSGGALNVNRANSYVTVAKV